jgi:tetraacyldisaccharide 4'-kinase
MYDNKVLKSYRFDVPVVSIGNITVGGTGKTPHTELIVRMLQDDFKITILSRGYKRKSKGYIRADEKSTVADIGDEPKQMARKFAGAASMVVCEDRAEGIRRIMEEDKADNQMIILDDAYQHRSVSPAVNILLIDYNRPIFEDHLLPWGDLRESCKESSRANIVIVTKCPPDVKPIDRRVFAKHVGLLPSQSIFFTNFEYQPLKAVFEDGDSEPNVTAATQVLLVTGIANTKTIEDYVGTKLSKNITHIKYKDHHNFSKKDVAKISSSFGALAGGDKIIVTTEKDAMRLNEIDFSPEIRRRMYYLPIEVNFVFDDEHKLKNEILKYVTEDKRNYRLHTTVRQF